MSSRRLPSSETVLRILRRESAESHYAYAPGCLSFEGIYAHLAIGGIPRAPATRRALDLLLMSLVDEGRVRVVAVTAPGGQPGGDWYEAVN